MPRPARASSAQEASGQYYALSPEFQVSVLRLPPVIVPNSLVFSPEGNVFYTCDTVEQEILAHDYSIKGGALSGRRVLASTFDIGGLPDGACIDEEGGLWVCLYDASRVVRFLPSGEIDETITLAAPRPTDCAIGGPDMRTLFITTARVGMSFMQLDARPLSGSLFATEIKVRGVRARGFGETGTLM